MHLLTSAAWDDYGWASSHGLELRIRVKDQESTNAEGRNAPPEASTGTRDSRFFLHLLEKREESGRSVRPRGRINTGK
jgi:hypothetical protein